MPAWHPLEPKVSVGTDAIVYRSVPFSASRHHPQARLCPFDIESVEPRGSVPRVLTHTGEFLPVAASDRDALIAFARRHKLPLVERDRPWDWLLEPFLDPESVPEEDLRALERLDGMGFSADEVTLIRVRVRKQMSRLTNTTMTWMGYGLFDGLTGMSLFGVGFLGFFGKDPRFYQDAMAIERRGRITRRLTGIYRHFPLDGFTLEAWHDL